MPALGRGSRWLVLRAWENSSVEQKAKLRVLFALNGKLARAYQVVEELRMALRAPDRTSIVAALNHVLFRTEKRANVPMRTVVLPSKVTCRTEGLRLGSGTAECYRRP